MRKLATIRRINAIQPIPEADAIEVATVGGWQVVVKKNEFKVNDLVLYLEIDSWVPTTLAPFLSKGKEPREFEGVKGERLRTIKLRGQISQGLILPLHVFKIDDVCILSGFAITCLYTKGEHAISYMEEYDLSELLNIKKYEKPVHANLAGVARGNFPTFIPKTDQERVQNLRKLIQTVSEQEMGFECTEKLDGTSCTVYGNSALLDEDKPQYGVCSRNLDLKETEGNVYWNIANKLNLHDIIRMSGRNLAIQGEIVGHGIQDNQYGFDDHRFYVFDIYDIDNRTYLLPDERQRFCQEYALDHVPVIYLKIVLTDNSEGSLIAKLLAMAEGKSIINGSEREGLVFKSLTDPTISFKAISNKWLLINE